jgi:hypothetical protein
MPRGRQQELRVWLPPALYDRVLRDAAVRGVSLSRCVRDRLEAHLALEEELLDVIERKDARSDGAAAGAALRLRLLDELEDRLAATLGRQAESLEQLATEVRLVICLVDRAYAGLIGNVALRDVENIKARAAQVDDLQQRWRKAVHRLWQEGGPVFGADPAEPLEQKREQSAGGG